MSLFLAKRRDLVCYWMTDFGHPVFLYEESEATESFSNDSVALIPSFHPWHRTNAFDTGRWLSRIAREPSAGSTVHNNDTSGKRLLEILSQ
jgi:hypothetical protein